MEGECCYVFNQFALHPARREISAEGVVQRLGSRAFDLLLVLVERRERTVGKHELMDLVWPRLVVEENNLQVQVLALRKLLGHGAIATVPGRGYRFTLPVRTAGTAGLPIVAGQGLAASKAAAHPLPEQPALFGRVHETAAVSALLDQHPVVTIAGAGGIGKTRLAQVVAAGRREQYGEEVCWVELSSISEPSLLGNALAQAMGLGLDGVQDAGSAALDALRGRSALVVLDNAEHLLDGVAGLVAAIRGAASGVRVLVTSQEVMHRFEEQVFRLGPLTLPSADAAEPSDGEGALALFVARARAADPRFVLGSSNRAAAVEICRRLDGIPLAIELAAARVPLLGAEGIRVRLDERFHLLTGGARAALRRHQTLRAALDWSHALLDEDERKVFRRLAVFVGSFALESVQAVATDASIDGWDVLDHLGGLVDKSLVMAEGEPVPRYRLLETTRLYALERLAEAGETEALLRAHAGHFAELAERMDAELAARGEGAAALERLDGERDEILHALGWCQHSPDPTAPAIGLRLIAALRYYWPSRGLIQLGLEHAESVLSRATHGQPPASRSQALASAANLASMLGLSERAHALASENLALCRSVGHASGLRTACLQLAWQCIEAGQPDAAEPLLQEVLQGARASGHARDEGRALNSMARLAADRGDLAGARQLLESLLLAMRAANQGHDLCIALLNVSDAACEAGDGERARVLMLEAVQRARTSGSAHLMHLVCRMASTVLRAVGELPAAVALLEFARWNEQRFSVGKNRPCDEQERQSILDAASAALAAAAIDAAQAEGRAMSPDGALSCIEQALARGQPSRDAIGATRPGRSA